MSTKNLPTTQGPFKAEYLRSGDPYELSRGHAIQCLPTGGRGSRANLLGGAVLASDPAVAEAGVDTGFAPDPGTLRAPDVAVGDIPDVPGWVPGVPLLALEYADYPLGNRGLSFRDQRQLLRQHWPLTLGFGGMVLVLTLIPLLNFLAMPAAVIGATLMWTQEAPE